MGELENYPNTLKGVRERFECEQLGRTRRSLFSASCVTSCEGITREVLTEIESIEDLREISNEQFLPRR